MHKKISLQVPTYLKQDSSGSGSGEKRDIRYLGRSGDDKSIPNAKRASLFQLTIKRNTDWQTNKLKDWRNKSRTRPSRPIRCDVWIVERSRTNALPTDQPTDTASYRGALSHLKRQLVKLNWVHAIKDCMNHIIVHNDKVNKFPVPCMYRGYTLAALLFQGLLLNLTSKYHWSN